MFDQETADAQREEERLTEIILIALKRLDDLDGSVALYTWEDDEAFRDLRAHTRAMREALERVYKRDDA